MQTELETLYSWSQTNLMRSKIKSMTRGSKELLDIKKTICKLYWSYIISIEIYKSRLHNLVIEYRFCDTFDRPKIIYAYTKGDHAFTAVDTRAKLIYKK